MLPTLHHSVGNNDVRYLALRRTHIFCAVGVGWNNVLLRMGALCVLHGSTMGARNNVVPILLN
jgi:hypothetical protein